MKVIKGPEDKLKDWNLKVTCQNERCNSEIMLFPEDIEAETYENPFAEGINKSEIYYFIICPCCEEYIYINKDKIPRKIGEEVQERKRHKMKKRKKFWDFLFK